MKKFLLALLAGLAISSIQPVLATQLPPEIKNYVLQNVPDATIRFDGLITLPDGTFYLPLIPAYTVKESEFGVKYTYPANKTFSKKPEILIFENNYCLLKLIKTKNKGLTVTSLQDLPIEVRTGILPQDLLVPKGLVLPDALVGILGDLNIPLTSNLQITSKQQIPQNISQKDALPKKPEKSNVIPQLRDKQFFITNFSSNFIYIMPSELRDVQYTLKLDSIPKTVNEVEGNYLLVSTNGKTYIDVVDIKNEEIAKQIDLGVEPDEMVVTKDEKTAYVISNKSPNLFVIDIPTMMLTKQIQIKGSPEKLNLSADESKLIYQDSSTGDIYSVELNNNYVNIYQCNVPNTSKMTIINDKVYVLSRTKNALRVFPYQRFVTEKTAEDREVLGAQKSYYIKSAFIAAGSATKNFLKKEQEEMEKLNYVENGETVETSVKPVDMILHNDKIYVLSASTNSIDVFNPSTNAMEKNISLHVPGFSNKINPIKGTNLVIITNVAEKEYVVVDLEKQIVLQTNPIDLQMTTLTVINKSKFNRSEKKAPTKQETKEETPSKQDSQVENL